MAYSLSATKLQTYARCPRSYFYRYEYGLKEGGMFGSAALGNALHRALNRIYRDWHYTEPLPPLTWLRDCWDAQQEGLSDKQVDEGWRILANYYNQHIADRGFQRPIATEGRIDASLIANGIEFKLTGRYDRLDALSSRSGNGLLLTDYKSTKTPQQPKPGAVDLQLGLYAIAIEQRYGQSLRQMQLLYLRTGQVITFEVTPAHRQKVQTTVSQLALKLLQDEDWQPRCAEDCSRCTYAKYCSAVTDSPEPLPQLEGKRSALQLSLGI